MADQSETLLTLTLEILRLLTGETFTAVKSGDHITVMAPPHHFVIPERTNKEKILELASKMVELLMGEIGSQSQLNIIVKEEMEEEEEEGEILMLGHFGRTELYKAAMMEYHPMDGSSERNPPESSLHHLYSRDSTQEGWEIPQYDQLSTPERSPPYSAQEGYSSTHHHHGSAHHHHSSAHYHQGEKLHVNMKEEEQPLMEEQTVTGEWRPARESPTVLVEEEALSADIGHEDDGERTMEGSVSCKVEDDSPAQPPDALDIHLGILGLGRPDPFIGEPSPVRGSHLVVYDTSGRRIKKGFQCCECGKLFRSGAIFRRHWRVHSGERPFPCSECGKCFTQKVHLLKHLRYHTGERPFACSECGKRFADRYTLTIHQKFHTGVDLYTCSECRKQFGDRAELTRHQRKHTGEKPYTCSECGKQYAKKSQFMEHLRFHTGAKPYTCSECGKQFSEKSRLTVHTKTHTGDKPHLCPVCGKGFMFKSYLAIHQRVHTGEKPFSCSECCQRFTRKDKLVEHQKGHMAGKPQLSSEGGELL